MKVIHNQGNQIVRMRTLRKERNLSVNELAEIINVKPETIEAIEYGEQAPKGFPLKETCSVLQWQGVPELIFERATSLEEVGTVGLQFFEDGEGLRRYVENGIPQ